MYFVKKNKKQTELDVNLIILYLNSLVYKPNK